MSDPQINQSILQRIRQIPADMRGYVEKRIELVSIEIGEKVGNILAKSASAVATALFVFMAFLFFLIASGFFLGDILNSYAAGFLIVSVLLFILALLVYLLAPEAIEDKVRERVSREFLGGITPQQNDSSPDNQTESEHDETVLVESPLIRNKEKN